MSKNKIRDLEKKNQELYIDLGAYQNENENLVKDIEKYWKLEEELGCSLEVIIEATTNGIIDFEGKEHTVVFGGYYLFVTENDKLICGFSLKNYRKTWWLKGERDE